MKAKLCIIAIGVGILLVFFGLLENNTLGPDAEKFFSGSQRDLSILFLVGGVFAISGGVLVFARAVTE